MLIFDNGARGRNRTGTVLPPRDFKSLASTNFATRAGVFTATGIVRIPTAKVTRDLGPERRLQQKIGRLNRLNYGGWARSRTEVDGFAGRCITTLPPSHVGVMETDDSMRSQTKTPADTLVSPRFPLQFGAGNETRTRDPNLGKVVLYQLSYSRLLANCIF